MKKILSIFAAALFAVAVNAAVWHVSPTSSDAEGEHSTCNIYRTLKAENAQPGDTVLLADGAYDETQSIYLNNSVVIMAEEGAHPVIMQASYFKLLASAKFIGVKFQHNAESNGYCMYFQPGCTKLELEGCEITNFKETCIMSWEEYALDELIINNCYIHDNVKSAVYDPSGYIANTVITNSTFANNDVSPWSAGLIDIRKGATGDPKLTVDHCTFYHNLLANSDYGEIRPRGLTDVLVSNCIFAQPEDYERVATRFSDNGGGGEVRNVITHHYTKRTNQWGHYDGATLIACSMGDPLFVDAANGDFSLSEGSPAINYAGKDADGNDITVTLGDPRWYATEPAIPTVSMAGSMNNWAANVEGYVFTPAEDGLTATLSFTPNEYYYELKIVVGNEWLSLNGNDGLYTLHRDWTTVSNMQTDQGNLKFLPDVVDQEYKLIYTYETKTLEIVYPIPVMSIAGSMNNWTPNVEGYIFTPAEDEKTASITFTPTENYYEFKVVRNDKWLSKLGDNDSKYWLTRENPTVSALYETGEGQNLVLSADEVNKPYTFTWTYANCTLEVTFPSQGTAIHNTAVEAKAVKMMENGQLVIIKNGVKYNALGTMVK